MNNDSSNTAKHILEMKRTGDTNGHELNTDFPNEGLTEKGENKNTRRRFPLWRIMYNKICIMPGGALTFLCDSPSLLEILPVRLLFWHAPKRIWPIKLATLVDLVPC